MQRHLEEIAAAVPAGRHAVVLADRAGWHLTPQLKVPANRVHSQSVACGSDLG